MRRLGVLVVGVSALALSACEPMSGNPVPIWAQGPVIEAQGRAYIEVPANRARFQVSFEGRAPTSEAASQQAVVRANLAAEAVRLAANGDVRITSNLSVRPYYEQVTERFGEGGERLVENRHPDSLLGYVATVSMNVVVLNPELTSDARGAALAAGPVNSGNVSFFLEPTAENQRSAFAAAVNDATERARIVAEAAGSQLGEIATLQEGQGPCLGRPSTETGYDDYARYSSAPPPPPPPPPSPPPPPPGSGLTAEQLLAELDRYALAADREPQRVTASVCAVFKVEDTL
ncbi:SIMPL domain-containing protein [Hyphobacterium sp.]|uniref:SIMPL domain-containing protein n=1 Tax=Hyphobacterium sp. TaxID=2004662 RepID=UPI003BAB3A6D